MAKKGGQVQLQAELNNDDEWVKFLQRDGLLVVDIYSEWCGPCSGMSGNLKKIKLEIGGDMLQLGMAKSDYIEQLVRFRKKSEPTWMFISKRKMVNLMFGADSPKLTRLIIDELKKEKMTISGEYERTDVLEITDLSAEEKVRVEVEETIKREKMEKEEAKKAKELLDRRTAECANIMENLPGLGVAIVFPNAKDKYSGIMTDLLNEAGLVIQYTEKVKITEEMLEELLYFPNTKFPKKTVEDIVSNKLSIALVLKRSSEGLSGDIDEVILQMVYGNSREPPGDDKSLSRSLMTKNDEDEENTIIGIWAPPNSLSKAVALKLLFPNLSGPFKLNGIEPEPLCVAVCYDAFKARDLMELSAQYPGQMIAYGFFTSDIPAEAQLIAKKMEEFEARTSPTSYEEKIVIQLAKTNPECFMAFCELGPSYMSSDAVVGEMECKLFFPPGYNAPVVEVTQVKKKSRKRGRKHAPAVNKEASITASDANIDQSEADHIEDENEEQESDDEKPSESVDTDNDILSGADKATSPMHEEKREE